MLKSNKHFDLKTSHLLLLLIFLVVIIRVFTAQMILVGGADTLDTWFAGKRILYGLPYDLFHRTARFGAIIPVFFTQLIFGTHAIVYYVAPSIASLISAIFMFKTGLMIRGKYFAFTSTLLFLVFPEVLVSGSHPRISSFSVMYMLISFYYLLKYYQLAKDSEKETAIIKNLLISCFFFFILYLTKVANLYLLPGFFLAIWLARKKFKDVFVYGFILLILFLVETLFYNMFTDFPLGRLQIILGSHVENITVTSVDSFWQIFNRYAPSHMERYWFFSILTGILSTAFLFFKRNHGKIKIIGFLLLSFLFFMTFLLKSLDPVTPINTFRTRYLTVIVPFLILIISYGVTELFNALNSKFRINFFKKVNLNLVLIFFTFLALFGAIKGFTLQYMHQFYKNKKVGYFDVHPYHLVPEYYQTLNNAYAKEIPVFIEDYSTRAPKRTVLQIQELRNKGISLEKAVEKLGITTGQYRYIKYRAENPTYRAGYVFQRVFWDEKRFVENMEQFSLPAMHLLTESERNIAVIWNPETKLQESLNQFLEKEILTINSKIYEVYTKPFRVEEKTFQQLINDK